MAGVGGGLVLAVLLVTVMLVRLYRSRRNRLPAGAPGGKSLWRTSTGPAKSADEAITTETHAGWDLNVYSCEDLQSSSSGGRGDDGIAVFDGEECVGFPYGLTVNPLYGTGPYNADPSTEIHQYEYANPEYQEPPGSVYSVMGEDGRLVVVGASNPTYSSARPFKPLHAFESQRDSARDGVHVSVPCAVGEPGCFLSASSSACTEIYSDSEATHHMMGNSSIETGFLAETMKREEREQLSLDETAL